MLMVDYAKNIKSTLSSICMVIPEITITSNTDLPCITYKEYSNIDLQKSESTRMSELKIQIKVFSNDYAEMESIALQVDTALDNLGFSRTFSDELGANGELQKIMRFTAKNKESR